MSWDALSLVIMSGLGSAGVALVFYVRHRDQRARDASRVTYRVELPTELTLDMVTAFTRSLTTLRPPAGSLLGRDSVVFEVVRRGGTTLQWLRVPQRRAAHVLAQLRGLIPGVRAEHVKQPALPESTWVRELQLPIIGKPLRTDQAESFASSLLHAAATTTLDEGLVYQLVVYPLGTSASLPTNQPQGATIGPRWWQTFTRTLALVLPQPPRDVRPASEQRMKLSEPLFGVALRIGARAGHLSRSRQLVSQIIGSVHQLDRPGAAFITRHLSQWRAVRRLRRATTPITRAPVYVNARELATLLVWLAGANVPNLARATGRDFPPARELPSDGFVLGRATYPGLERPIAVSRADALMHTLVTGPTGSGKSTLLLNRMKQTVDAGHGLILIDPGGDLATDLINCLPAHRTNDLIYLNPADEQAVALNPLACALEDAELVADQMLELIRDRSDSWGVQIDETLKATLVLLAASPDMTLTEIPAVLLNASFRARLLSQLDPVFAPTVGEFFARYESRSQPQQAQDAAAVLNKVSPLLDRRPIRAMLGQAHPTWSMRSAIDEGKILVVSLPSGVVGPVAADLIGGMVAQMAWNAALGRASLLRQSRRPVSLVIDELPRFVRGGVGLTDLLARARSHDLDLTAAVQHLGQVDAQLRAALLSEARNKVIFQPAADDAQLLARHLLGARPEDLLGLAPRTAFASLVAGGRVSPPVTIATFPPPQATGFGDAARAASRAQYGRDRGEVEQAIQDRRRTGGMPGPRRTRRLS
ncbi:type IV secretion system DNA-binding domain-containing protein [Saccharothrix sp. NPDC042600]|uniref:type IV secretory system conjugative DNA transfer family protein n=1 Tax=Saccharothrix TaxID=2071 RepID=UPI0033C5EC3F|nr:type IV secretory system conjugative DNA transfer family protein [Saccharothrix mutabilis subsp. capreolus]